MRSWPIPNLSVTCSQTRSVMCLRDMALPLNQCPFCNSRRHPRRKDQQPAWSDEGNILKMSILKMSVARHSVPLGESVVRHSVPFRALHAVIVSLPLCAAIGRKVPPNVCR